MLSPGLLMKYFFTFTISDAFCDGRGGGGGGSGEPANVASFRGCMTHVALSIKKPSGRRAVLLQDRADVTPEIH